MKQMFISFNDVSPDIVAIFKYLKASNNDPGVLTETHETPFSGSF